MAVGTCGTDVEIVEGGYGWVPQCRDRLLVLGYESLGRVLDPGPTSSLAAGRPSCRHRVGPARGGRPLQELT